MRVMQRNVRFMSEDPTNAYLVTLELVQHDPPQLVLGTPTLTIDLCNTVIENGNRDALGTGGLAVPGESWTFIATNTVHDPQSLTDAYFNIFGLSPYSIFYSATMLPYEQGMVAPYSAWPGRMGTFTVPTGAGSSSPFSVSTKSDYGGDATVDECWRVQFFRL